MTDEPKTYDKLERAIAEVIKEILKSEPPAEAVSNINDTANKICIEYLVALIGENGGKKSAKTIAELNALKKERSGYLSISLDINLDEDPNLTDAEKQMFKNLHVGLVLSVLNSNTQFDVLLPADKGVRSIVYIEVQKMVRSIMLFESALQKAYPKLYNRVKGLLHCDADKIIDMDEWFSAKYSKDKKSKIMVNAYLFDASTGVVYHKKNLENAGAAAAEVKK